MFPVFVTTPPHYLPQLNLCWVNLFVCSTISPTNRSSTVTTRNIISTFDNQILLHYITIQYNTMQCNAMQCNAMQYNTVPICQDLLKYATVVISVRSITSIKLLTIIKGNSSAEFLTLTIIN